MKNCKISTLCKASCQFASILAIFVLSNNATAQDICPYTGGLTLCQEFGSEPIQINILSPESTSNWPIITWNANTVFINATLTVNSLFNVTNSTVRFGPNGRIIVVAGGDFRSNNSRYFSCDAGGWPGILAEGGITNFNTNDVEDAQNAITIASSSAALTITGNTFNRNIVDIFLPGIVNANALIVGNIFDATSPNFAGTRPVAGILAQGHSAIFVGLPQTNDVNSKNIFRNHQRGAEGQNAILNFRYAEFNCNSVNGIFSERVRLDIRGSGAFRNLFSRNFSDIHASGSNLFVYDSDFNECLTDNITSDNNLNGQIVEVKKSINGFNNRFEIDNNNDFVGSKSAIILERSSGGGLGVSNTIENNDFIIHQFDPEMERSAIRATGFPGTIDVMRIWSNAVIAGPGGSSPAPTANDQKVSPFIEIYIGNAPNYNIRFNHIFSTNLEVEELGFRWGFFLHNWESPSSGNWIFDNEVKGQPNNASNYDFGLCAFHFFKSGPWNICDNITDFTLRGFHLTDDCATSVFAGNNIGNHRRFPGSPNTTAGLLLENTQTKIGPQFCRHNTWTANSYIPDWGAWFRSPSPAAWATSRFDYNPNIPDEDPVHVAPLNDWFYDQCNLDPPPPNQGAHCGELLYSTTLDQFELKIVQDNQGYVEPISVMDWEKRREILVKLIRYPELKTNYPEANIFYNIQINNSAGQFAQFDEMLHNARLIAPNVISSLNDLRTQITGWINKIDSLDGTIANMASAQDLSSQFFYYRSSLLSEIGQLIIQQDALEYQIETTRNTNLALCSQYLNALPQSMVYETNQKFLNSLSIKRGNGTPFSENDFNILRAIVAQCPEIAGYTRERAMNNLPIGDQAVVRNDTPHTPGCQGFEQEEERTTSTFIERVGIHITPNPVTNVLAVYFEAPFSGSIEVFDLSGRVTFQSPKIKLQNTFAIPVDNLVSGVYLLSTRADSGERIVQKFAVSK